MSILRLMSDFFAQAAQFDFAVHSCVETTRPSGAVRRRMAIRKWCVLRPDRLIADFNGEGIDKCLWYDRGQFAIFDRQHRLYGTARVPETIDKMLSFTARRFGIVLPLADLLVSNVYAALTDRVNAFRHEGVQMLGTHDCHHLSLTTETFDWQVWIGSTGVPVPWKIEIDYKTLCGRPRYTGRFAQWHVAPKLSAEMFAFRAPSGARHVGMLTDLPPEPGALATCTIAKRQPA
jgi:hypothetical protein